MIFPVENNHFGISLVFGQAHINQQIFDLDMLIHQKP